MKLAALSISFSDSKPCPAPLPELAAMEKIKYVKQVIKENFSVKMGQWANCSSNLKIIITTDTMSCDFSLRSGSHWEQ